MIETQVDSRGIEFLIDIVLKVDDFDSVSAKLLSPTGAISTLTATKDTETVVRVPLEDKNNEIGIYELQVIGLKGSLEAYSEVLRFKSNKNVKDIF